MAEIDIEGLDEILESIDNLDKKAKALDGINDITYNELFPNSFMKNYTEFISIDKMFEKSQFKVESKKDLENIPEDKLDEFVKNNTIFNSWKKMINKAGTEWVAKKLDL